MNLPLQSSLRHHVWTVLPDSAGLRLDVFVSLHVQTLSRSGAAREIHLGHVHIQNSASTKSKNAKPATLLQTGQVVVYEEHPPLASRTLAQELPLQILYQDKDLAVVNKPAGMVTHPAAGHQAGTLVNALLYHLGQLSGIGGEQRPGIVHRLDKDTSGLLLVAKHDQAHQLLSAALQSRDISREYQAVVWGQPPSRTWSVENRVGRDPRDRKRFTVIYNGPGKSAKTLFQVEQRFSGFSLLRAQLATGRTHQIRIHCHHMGMPVVGDRVYGRRGEAHALLRLGLTRPQRQLLHAAALSFTHPLREKRMHFTAPWPEDFAEFVSQLQPSADQEHCQPA